MPRTKIMGSCRRCGSSCLLWSGSNSPHMAKAFAYLETSEGSWCLTSLLYSQRRNTTTPAKSMLPETLAAARLWVVQVVRVVANAQVALLSIRNQLSGDCGLTFFAPSRHATTAFSPWLLCGFGTVVTVCCQLWSWRQVVLEATSEISEVTQDCYQCLEIPRELQMKRGVCVFWVCPATPTSSAGSISSWHSSTRWMKRHNPKWQGGIRGFAPGNFDKPRQRLCSQMVWFCAIYVVKRWKFAWLNALTTQKAARKVCQKGIKEPQNAYGVRCEDRRCHWPSESSWVFDNCDIRLFSRSTGARQAQSGEPPAPPGAASASAPVI